MVGSLLSINLGTPDSGRRATRDEWDSFYRFTVVRNPWARVHSWYRNVMRYRRRWRGGRATFAEFVAGWGEEPKDGWALRPQLYWIADFDGSLPYHRVIRFESLAEGAAEVFRDLGLSNVTLPHALNYGAPDYRSAYDDESAERVAERYADEIARFGYSFDEVARPEPSRVTLAG